MPYWKLYSSSARIDFRTSIIQKFFNWFFFIIEYTTIASYANDNTLSVSADNIDGAIKSLEEASKILFKWFNDKT